MKTRALSLAVAFALVLAGSARSAPPPPELQKALAELKIHLLAMQSSEQRLYQAAQKVTELCSRRAAAQPVKPLVQIPADRAAIKAEPAPPPGLTPEERKKMEDLQKQIQEAARKFDAEAALAKQKHDIAMSVIQNIK